MGISPNRRINLALSSADARLTVLKMLLVESINEDDRKKIDELLVEIRNDIDKVSSEFGGMVNAIQGLVT
jgi:hypothetical protein